MCGVTNTDIITGHYPSTDALLYVRQCDDTVLHNKYKCAAVVWQTQAQA